MMLTKDTDTDMNVIDALLVPEYRARFIKALGLRVLSGGTNSEESLESTSPEHGERAVIEMLERIARTVNRELAARDTVIILFSPSATDSHITGNFGDSSPEEIATHIAQITTLANNGFLATLDGSAKLDDVVDGSKESSDVSGRTLLAPIRMVDKLIGVIAGIKDRDCAFTPSDEAKITVAAVLFSSGLRQIASEKQNDRRLSSLAHALSAALDARDPKTSGHSNRVAMYAMAILNELGYDESDWSRRQIRSHIRVAALLHDLGKVGIPDNILLKHDSLTSGEYDCVKTHPIMGAEILMACYGLRSLVPGVLYHHEHFDGSGYPFGLRGEKIPFMARVIAVADAFDAITTDRPFSAAASHEEGIRILTEKVSSIYDPAIVEALVHAHQKGTLKYVRLPSEAKTTDRSSYDDVEKIYGRNLQSIPSLPNVLNTVNSLLDDPATSLQEIGKVLSTDEGLASRVLKLVNSAYYGLPRMVSTIPLAMTILGAKAVKSHVVNIAYSDLMCNLAGNSEEYSLLWRHALSTGSWARAIATKSGEVDPEEAFTAGLIHDVGQALCLRFRPDAYGKLVREAYKSGKPLLGVEKEVVGIDHTRLGAWAASRWRLPEPLVNAVAWHHDPGLVDEESGDIYRLVRVIHMADIAARAMHASVPFTRFMLVEISPLVLRELGSEYLINLETMQEQVKEIEEDLESMLGQAALASS
jgi:putative nucleotidyltransferase with HDIG domain